MPRSDMTSAMGADDAPRILIAGMPAPTTIFLVSHVQQIWQNLYGEVIVRAANAAGDVADIAQAAVPVLIYTDVPDADLVLFAADHRIPVIMVREGFLETATFCMVARQMDVLDAARFVTQSIATIDAFRGYGLIAGHVDRSTTIDALAALVRTVTPGVDADAVTSAVTDIVAHPDRPATLHPMVEGAVALAADVSPHHFALLPEAQAILSAMAPGYDLISAGETGPVTIDWPVRTMLEALPPHASLDRSISLLGPARALSLGPFFHLPSGTWHVEVEMESGDHLGGNTLMIDIVTDGCEAPMFEEQVFGARLCNIAQFCFAINQPKMPVEVRFHLRRGSIGGFFKARSLFVRNFCDPVVNRNEISFSDY